MTRKKERRLAVDYIVVGAGSAGANIAFGGKDMRTAYITQTQSGELLRVRWPEPGLRLHFNA